MPAVAEEPVRGFALSDFDVPNKPADDTSKNQAAPAKEEPAKEAPPAETEGVPTDAPDLPERPADEAMDKKEDDPGRTLQNAMDEQPEATRKAEEEAAAADAKNKADGAAAKPAEDAAKARDADLNPEWGPHTHPNTRKKFEAVAEKAKAARDERDAVIAEREALKKERDNLAEKAKGVEPPKELMEEVKTLRERVRELDITKDPVLIQKYDNKITANNDRIIGVLKAQGYHQTRIKNADGSTKEMIDNPTAIPQLLKNGLTLKNLQPLITALEKEDLFEEADEIRESLRENGRLQRSKTEEVETWKGDYTKRQKERETLTQQQQEKQQAAYRDQTHSILAAETEELAKNFPYIKKPAGPLPTDPPAVVQAKQKAIEEFDAASKKIEAAVSALNPVDAPPEKMAEIVGRINASAIQAQTLKMIVLPRVLKELAARDARNKELQARIDKIENAGRISRAQSSSGGEPGAYAGKPDAQTLEDAFKQPPQV